MVDVSTLSRNDLERADFANTIDQKVAKRVLVEPKGYSVSTVSTYYVLVDHSNLSESAIIQSYANTGNSSEITGDSIKTYYDGLKKYYSDTYLKTYVLLETNTPYINGSFVGEVIRRDDLDFVIRKYNLSEISDVRAIDTKNGCVSLDGTSEYMYTESNSGINLTGSFTYSTWLKVENNNANSFVASVWDEFQDNRSWYLQLEGNNRVELLLCEDGTAGTRTSVKSSSTLSFDEWVMLTVVFDANNTVTFYENDTSIGSSSVSVSSIFASGERLYIGAKQFNDITNTYFKGKYATGAMFNTALSHDDIKNLYRHGRKYDLRTNKNAANLVFYTQFGRDFDPDTTNGREKVADQEIVYQNIDSTNILY